MNAQILHKRMLQVLSHFAKEKLGLVKFYYFPSYFKIN